MVERQVMTWQLQGAIGVAVLRRAAGFAVQYAALLHPATAAVAMVERQVMTWQLQGATGIAVLCRMPVLALRYALLLHPVFAGV
ncbi:MAG: hypothetical protein PVF08_03765 [Gammaproteobacteria bacterium]|jgi:hypothetical protein